MNLRGMQDTGGAFMVPTYIFIACMLGMIAIGLAKAIAAGGHPTPVIAPAPLHATATAVTGMATVTAFSRAGAHGDDRTKPSATA